MPLTCIYLCLLDYRFFEGRVLVLFIIPSHITYSISQHIFIVLSAWGGVRSVQLLSHIWLLTPWTAACQASLTITSFLKLMAIESVMPSNHLILCHPLLLLPSIFPSIRVFSNESVLRIRWAKFWSFSFSISPSNIKDWFPLGWTGWNSLQSKDSKEASPTP